jgi:transposase-like protein
MVGNDLTQIALESLPHLIDQARLRCWFLSVFHQSQIKCCHCGSQLSPKATKSFLEYRITSCVTCGKKVQFFRGTIFQNAKISPEQFIVLVCLLEFDVPNQQIADAIGITRSAVLEWSRKLKKGSIEESVNGVDK